MHHMVTMGGVRRFTEADVTPDDGEEDDSD
jgi:hypothetical protein